MVADPKGTFHDFWFSNMVTPEHTTSLLTSTIAVDGRAWRNGDALLESFHDITPRVAVEMMSSRYDRAAGTIDLTMKLVNNSRETIRAPVYMRIYWMDSKYGRVAFGSPTLNGNATNGAVADVSEVPLAFKVEVPKDVPLTESLFDFEARFFSR